MAPRDRTTDSAAVDDWFTDPKVTESVSTVGTSGDATERRLTVLTAQQIARTDPDDDWFDDGPYDDRAPSAGVGADGSFDDRTSSLRTHGPHTTPERNAPSWWRRHRSTVAVIAALMVLVGAGAAVAVVLTGVGEEPQPSAALLPDDIVTITTVPTSAAPAAAGAAAADVTWCRGQAGGDPVTENSDEPGAAAIWRFEKAFYFDRDGVAARAAGAPDAVMASAQRLQAGIDQLEPDIEFCVLADPIDTGIYDVTVVERGPGIDGRISRQRITTTPEQPGGVLISAIVPR